MNPIIYSEKWNPNTHRCEDKTIIPSRFYILLYLFKFFLVVIVHHFLVISQQTNIPKTNPTDKINIFPSIINIFPSIKLFMLFIFFP